MNNHAHKFVVYIGHINNDFCVVGNSNNIEETITKFVTCVNRDFKPEFIIETRYGKSIEEELKLKLEKRMSEKTCRLQISYNLVKVDQEFTMNHIIGMIIDINSTFVNKEVIVGLIDELEKISWEKEELERKLKIYNNVMNEKKQKIIQLAGGKIKGFIEIPIQPH